ncbi:unnamed protein product [Taenia asiatica]|uniref:Mesencephalic astrocyte-derived neurotrophic factor homolog n=1 Tax=Taenia asiatica TaxID=60517 RepID=A0A0R3W6H1_TAEAS|nr:unnamed protein product [Taenia asiatica]
MFHSFIFCSPVCIEVMDKLQRAVDENKGSDVVKIIDDACSTFTGKHRKICSNIGALPNSPTRVVNEVARQLSISVPAEKICQNLFNPLLEFKMSVKELKQTLAFIGVECTGCMDKSDFIEMAEKNRDKIPRSDL